MISLTVETLTIVIALVAVAGLCSNAFIVFSLIFNSIKESHTAACNYILIALSISNVYYTIISSANFLMNRFWSSFLLDPNTFYIVYFLTLCGITSSSWLTASLCFFYFVKIQQFQPGILAWMKVKIDKTVPWLILTAELVSLPGGFLSLLIWSQELPNNSTNLISEGTSEHKKTKLTLMNTFLIINSLPFLVAIMTTSSCVWFLKEQRSAGTFGTTNMRDYRSAVQTMTRLVTYYAVMYLVFMIYGLGIFPNMSWGYWVCTTSIFSFALVQSGLLISGNPKLREAWRQFFTFR